MDMEHLTIQDRAQASAGTSGQPIYQAVTSVIKEFQSGEGGTLLDVGCGTGQLYSFVRPFCASYIGLDVIRYDGLQPQIDFRPADLDAPSWPVEPAVADITVSVETIEHLENPRAFFRELARVTKP